MLKLQIVPWTKTEHVEQIPDNGQKLLGKQLRWTRQGRRWANEECDKLVMDIEAAWSSMFSGGSKLSVSFTMAQLDHSDSLKK